MLISFYKYPIRHFAMLYLIDDFWRLKASKASLDKSSKFLRELVSWYALSTQTTVFLFFMFFA